MKLRVEQYNDNTTGIREAVASLIGCRRDERPNESNLLRRVLSNHAGDELIRNNEPALRRRTQMVERAQRVLEEMGV
jgi:hypothetical protein